MNMKPIPLNTDMVRRLLNGEKTVTRRVVKPQPEKVPIPIPAEKYWLGCFTGDDVCRLITPPYCPGDILYVPEPWKCRDLPNAITLGYEVVFKDGSIINFQFADRKRFDKWRKYWDKPDNQWQSPYFMPREAARIFLRVTDVRVERLQEITPDQLRAEGVDLFVTPSECKSMMNRFGAVCKYERKKKDFSALWDSTIKKADRDLYGWEANPWVWVIEFERCEKP